MILPVGRPSRHSIAKGIGWHNRVILSAGNSLFSCGHAVIFVVIAARTSDCQFKNSTSSREGAVSRKNFSTYILGDLTVRKSSFIRNGSNMSSKPTPNRPQLNVIPRQVASGERNSDLIFQGSAIPMSTDPPSGTNFIRPVPFSSSQSNAFRSYIPLAPGR